MNDDLKLMPQSPLDELDEIIPKDLPKITDFVQFQIDKYNNTTVPDKGYPCKLCGNKGMIAVKTEIGTMALKRCKCYKVRENRRKIDELGLMHYLSKCPSLQDLPENEEWEKGVKKMLILFDEKYSDRAWLYIGGQNGSGKTTKATIILYNLLSKYPNKLAAYFNWDIQYKELISKWNKETQSYDKNEIMDWLKEVDILYIDDFARHRNGTWYDNERDVAKELIDYRYQTRKQTIITSELYYKELRKLDEAISGRIYERCGGKNMFAISIGRGDDRDYRSINTFDDEGIVL